MKQQRVQLKIFIVLLFITMLFSSCSKNENLMYGALASIGGIEIQDIYPVNDSILVIAGNDASQNGKIILLNVISKESTSYSTESIIRDISSSSNGLWACGDSMILLHSTDDGKIWNTWANFDYFWTVDRANFKELYVENTKLLYAIGSKNLLNGNLYVASNILSYPFLSKQLQAGVNDMVVADSTQAYVACYGSILKVEEEGKKVSYENIGGHNFTGITFSGSRTIISCTYEGTIHKKELDDSDWKEVVKSRIPFRFIASDTYGNVIAIGESNTIYISNDFGENWHLEKYKNGRDVTSLVFENEVFYIGTKSGEIHAITRNQIE